jgi:hypothetical protein
MMEKTATPMRHDTKNPLACCLRCHKAELAGRCRIRPVFRYDKVETVDPPVAYQVFHGEHHVATLSRTGKPGPKSYEVQVEWDAGGEELRTGSLRDARVLAEEAYTAVWREGRYSARGPVREL